MTFRDFNAHDAVGGHPDFEPGYASDGAVQGLVSSALDEDGKPVQSTLSAATAENAFMHGQAAFAEWYRDDPPSSGPISGELVLWNDGSGRYVNRWGRKGEQWQGRLQQSDYGLISAGLPAGQGCSSPDDPTEGCEPGPGQVCYDPCIPWGNGQQQSCCADVPALKVFDGNPLFFPLDGASGVLTDSRVEGKVPAQYGWPGWPSESSVAQMLGIQSPLQTATAVFPSTGHNFSFTSEVSFWFRYRAAATITFEVTGDDDLWVFLNGRLALDMGGWHVPLNGRLTVDAEVVTAANQLYSSDDGTGPETTHSVATSTYGLADGGLYELKVFHAERQSEGSSFRFGVSGLDAKPSLCVPTP